MKSIMGHHGRPLFRMLPVLVLAVATGLAACGGQEVCSACGRHECANLAFSITLENGQQVNTCCPRCGLHYLVTDRKDARVASLHVRDFETAKTLDATTAVYVSGSDVHPCLGVNTEPPRDERGPIAAAFDRCEPSLVAFSGREPALRFIARHGGTITTWQRLSAAVGWNEVPREGPQAPASAGTGPDGQPAG